MVLGDDLSEGLELTKESALNDDPDAYSFFATVKGHDDSDEKYYLMYDDSVIALQNVLNVDDEKASWYVRDSARINSIKSYSGESKQDAEEDTENPVGENDDEAE